MNFTMTSASHASRDLMITCNNAFGTGSSIYMLKKKKQKKNTWTKNVGTLNMSLRKGDRLKKGQKYKNVTAYKPGLHVKSKRTQEIAAVFLPGVVCQM